MNFVLKNQSALLMAVMLSILLTGCATTPHPQGQPVGSSVTLPADCLVTQRAILTARGKQFALNGYMSQNAAGERRLIVTETFGKVLADVLVKQDGTVHVMRSGPPFRPAWISRYLAKDMQCIFDGKSDPQCKLRVISPTHFAIERRWYKLDVQIVQTSPGKQPADLFDAASAPLK